MPLIAGVNRRTPVAAAILAAAAFRLVWNRHRRVSIPREISPSDVGFPLRFCAEPSIVVGTPLAGLSGMTQTTSGSVRQAQRVLLALTIAIPSAYLAWFCGALRGYPSDFGLVWAAARFLKAGTNPYAA